MFDFAVVLAITAAIVLLILLLIKRMCICNKKPFIIEPHIDICGTRCFRILRLRTVPMGGGFYEWMIGASYKTLEEAEDAVKFLEGEQFLTTTKGVII